MLSRAIFRVILLISLLALVSAAQANTVSAEINTWTSIGPDGGSVFALALDPATPATLYAGTEHNGVFKSTDGGGSWIAVNSGLTNTNVQALAIDPATPTTLYVGTWRSGVFKSTTGGGSWIAVNDGLTHTDVRALAIDPATPSTLFAGTGGGGVFVIQQLEHQLHLPIILRGL